MNDRELLEMAAKAAGIYLDWHVPDGASPWVITGEGVDRGPGYSWGPLVDDGDALRLAAKLDLAIEFGRSSISISAPQTPEQSDDDERGDLMAVELWQTSEVAKLKAMRLVIVRAAAEIGRAMP